MTRRRAVILVGHGAIPRDYPRELVARLKVLEAERRARGAEPTDEERELDRRIRTWPRRADTDPYQAGFHALAARLERALGDAVLFALAYNEFCAPTVEEAITDVIKAGAMAVSVVPSMLTPGGSHAEVDIPESLARLRAQHPDVPITYAWPFDLDAVARMLVEHLNRFAP